jgi:hypothetical protein
MLEEINGFFFDVMVTKSWAQGDEGVPIPNMPGWNQITYEDPRRGLKLVDRWGKDSYNSATGSLLITRHEVPEWVMWVGNDDSAENYVKSALPFLRNVLLSAYKERMFYGGRGQPYYTDRQLNYVNMFEGDFAEFRSIEVVVDLKRGMKLGSHKCWGGSLLQRGWRRDGPTV